MEDTPYSQWIRFAQACWDKYGVPKKVVDLGCGTGNISIPLAQTGLQVIGIDLSSDMLAVAQEKAEYIQRTSSFAPGGSLLWRQQDMRDWVTAQKVDSVVSFCDCFNYLTEEDEIIRAFERVITALEPGGVFIFDVHTPMQLNSYAAEQPFILNEENIAYIWTCEFDADRCEIEHDLSIFAVENKDDSQNREGKWFRRIDEVHIQRAYSLEWLETALKNTGFRHVHSFADFLFQAPTEQSQRAFFVAIK